MHPRWRGCKVACKGELFFFTPPKRVTSPTWGPPLPCKQALRLSKEQPFMTSNCLISRFAEDVNARQLLFVLLSFDTVFQNSTPEKFANILRNERDEISAIKFEAFVAVEIIYSQCQCLRWTISKYISTCSC